MNASDNGASATDGPRLIRLFKPRLVRDTGWAFLLKGIQITLGFLATVVLARMLGAEGYGTYAYAYALALLLALPLEAGMPQLLVRETARGVAEGNLRAVRGVWRWSLRMLGVTTLAVGVLIGPFLVLWQGGIGDVAGRTMAWALALIPIVAVANLGGAALRGLKRIAAGQIPEFLLRPGGFLLLLGAIVVLGGGSISPDGAMALHVIAAGISAIGGVWLLWRSMPIPMRRASPSGERSGLLATTFLFTLLTGFQVINAQSDTVILGILVSPDQVGVYRVAVQVATLASVGMHMVNIVLAPRFADLYTGGNFDRLQRLVTAGARVGLVVNLVLTIMFLVLGNSFFSAVFGAEFESSFAPLMILLVGQLASTAAGSAGNLLNMTGHERTTAKTMAITATLNIGLNFVLIPLWGLLGAATASAATRVLWSVLLVRRARIDLGINSRAFRA